MGGWVTYSYNNTSPGYQMEQHNCRFLWKLGMLMHALAETYVPHAAEEN